MLLLIVIIGIFNFCCTSAGYDYYLRHRTFNQKLEDERRQEEIRMEYYNNKNNENAMKRFNDKIKLNTSNKNDSIKDTINLLLRK